MSPAPDGVRHYPIGLFVFWAIVAAPLVAGAFFNRTSVVGVAPQPSVSIPEGWQVFTSTDGGFSVAGPGPGYEAPPQVGDDGTIVRQVTILGTHEGSLIVYWTDHENGGLIGPSDEILTSALRAYAAQVGGTQTPGPVHMVGSLRCQDVTLRPTSIVDRVRVCLSGNRLFEIVSRYTAGSSSRQAEAFIESFRLIDDA